jgi:hypothetical protein
VSRKLPKLAELNRRALAGEDLSTVLTHPHDEIVRAHLEGLIDDLRRGVPLNDDDRPLVIAALEAYVLPGQPGRLPDQPPSAETIAKRQAKDAAIAWGRSYHEQIKPGCLNAAEAWERTAAEMRSRYPSFYAGKTTKTIRNELSRHPSGS